MIKRNPRNRRYVVLTDGKLIEVDSDKQLKTISRMASGLTFDVLDSLPKRRRMFIL